MNRTTLTSWVGLRCQLWPDHSQEGHIRDGHDILSSPDKSVSFLATDNQDRAVAFADATVRHDYVNGCESSPVVYLEGIFVIPELRGKDIARQLVAAIQDWGVSKGCTEMASDTSLDNFISHRMHKALGFEETERVVFFRKKLAANDCQI